ncbi:MAG: ATP phosphoribosyltransferase regulatory subunit [Bacillota bacterium]
MELKLNGLPEGMAFYLPDKARSLDLLKNNGQEILEGYGYEPLYVPALLPYSLVSSGVDEEKVKNYYKLIDYQGDILVLRPEMTSAIASLVAREQDNITFPARFYYYSSVYRHESTQSGKDREIYQLGAERFGGNQDADIEILMLVQKIIETAGLNDFHVEVGNISFLEEVFSSLKLDDGLVKRLKAKLASRDLVGYRNICLELGQNRKNKLLKLLKLRGGPEIFSEAEEIIDGENKSLDHLKKIYGSLKLIGMAKRINFDLTLMRNLDYYTGIVFEVMSPNLGYNICGGGRYDKLLSRFGVESIPAVGFAIGMERLRLAVNGGKSLDKSKQIEVYISEVNALVKSYELINALQTGGYETLVEYGDPVNKKLTGNRLKIKVNDDDRFEIITEKDKINFELIAEVLEYVEAESEDSNA